MIIDIVTPTFNRATFLEKTLESVTSQRTVSDIHYYIMDGGSTDETIPIISRHIKDNTNQKIKIELFVGEDEGMYDAIYKGFKKGYGEIMAWINSDDVYLPEALSTVETIFNRYKNIDWIIGTPAQINEFGNIIGVHSQFPLKSQLGIRKGIYTFKNSRQLCPVIQQDSIFWRRRLWDKLSDETLNKFRSHKYSGDLFLWREFAKYSGMHHVKSILSCFRIHGNQITTDMKKYENEMQINRPSVKDTLISFLLNVPIMSPNSLKYKHIYRMHRRLAFKHQCNLIYWDANKNDWSIHPEQ